MLAVESFPRINLEKYLETVDVIFCKSLYPSSMSLFTSSREKHVQNLMLDLSSDAHEIDKCFVRHSKALLKKYSFRDLLHRIGHDRSKEKYRSRQREDAVSLLNYAEIQRVLIEKIARYVDIKGDSVEGTRWFLLLKRELHFMDEGHLSKIEALSEVETVTVSSAEPSMIEYMYSLCSHIDGSNIFDDEAGGDHKTSENVSEVAPACRWKKIERRDHSCSGMKNGMYDSIPVVQLGKLFSMK